jgi:exonuclease VII large subunit
MDDGQAAPSLYRQRAAQRGAKLRARRAQYRPEKPRKSAEQREAEREARGAPTLRERRGNLPSYTKIRSMLTHIDTLGRGYYVADDAFGVVLTKDEHVPPANGELVSLKSLEDEHARPVVFALYSIERVGKKLFNIAAPESLD